VKLSSWESGYRDLAAGWHEQQWASREFVGQLFILSPNQDLGIRRSRRHLFDCGGVGNKELDAWSSVIVRYISI